VFRAADALALRSLTVAPQLPPHLAGVPAVLHKYEPLLRAAWERQEAAGAAPAVEDIAA
jgi:hypothetical protein